VLVTFLWRGAGSLSDVIVFASVLPDNDPVRQRLTHLAETDVWYRTYQFPSDVPILYELSTRGLQGLQRDPLNKQHLDGPMGGSVAVLPGVRNGEWSRPGAPSHGAIDRIQFRGERLPGERSVTVYLPASFARGKEYDTLVVLDEDVYTGPVPLTTMLDNLIAARQIRPVIAVLIGNRERASELSCSSTFSRFIARELLPALATKYEFRRRRDRTTILGSSLGGLAAACAGIHEPDQFGSVIAISASFRWRPKGDPQPEWLARHVAASPAAPLRFLIGVGSYETGTPNEPGSPSLLTCSRHMRDVLTAKGYGINYREFPGAHEPLSWRFAIPDFLKGLQ
jgi:enterochelin esterase family protein